MTANGSAEEQWNLAVELGAVGHHAAARTILRRLRGTADPSLRSLAASTEASLLRQRGLHAAAAPHDGRALVLVPPARSGTELGDSARADEARADALIGLAADALGANRPDIATALLNRCPTVGWRTPIRLAWVRAETAIVAGRSADALHHAHAASRAASQSPSERHRIKSDLILAAASLTAGDRDTAVSTVEHVRGQALRHGWIPLAWAAEMLAVALGDRGAQSAAQTYADILARRGGTLA